MKSFILTLVLLISAAAEAREFLINVHRPNSFDGRTFDLKDEIDQLAPGFDFHDYKITHVRISGQSANGRYADASGVYLQVRGNGSCQTNQAKLQKRGDSDATVYNPNRNNISDGDWILGVCGRMRLYSIRIFTEKRQQGGGRPNPPRPNPNPGPGNQNPSIMVWAKWNPSYSVEKVYEEAHTVVIRNPVNNRNKIQIDDIQIEIETRGGRSSEWLDLSQYKNQYLKPGQKLEIPMPKNRRGDYVRTVLAVELLLESWERSGEKVRVVFKGGRRGNNNHGGGGHNNGGRRDNNRPGSRR